MIKRYQCAELFKITDSAYDFDVLHPGDLVTHKGPLATSTLGVVLSIDIYASDHKNVTVLWSRYETFSFGPVRRVKPSMITQTTFKIEPMKLPSSSFFDFSYTTKK